MESVIYEGHGPAATGFIVECLTDNRKRTAPALRHLFTKYGGDLGVVGSVGWMFDTKGWFEIDPATAGKSADELMELAMEGEVEDVSVEDGLVIATTEMTDFARFRSFLAESEVEPLTSEVRRIPNVTVEVPEAAEEAFEKLLDALDEDDDVQQVFHNAS